LIIIALPVHHGNLLNPLLLPIDPVGKNPEHHRNVMIVVAIVNVNDPDLEQVLRKDSVKVPVLGVYLPRIEIENVIVDVMVLVLLPNVAEMFPGVLRNPGVHLTVIYPVAVILP